MSSVEESVARSYLNVTQIRTKNYPWWNGLSVCGQAELSFCNEKGNSSLIPGAKVIEKEMPFLSRTGVMLMER